MAKAIDRRSARTRKALHGALISLILRKGYEAVTIQDLIDEADVGRSTFYAHYTGKEDLLRNGFDMLRTQLAEARRDALSSRADHALAFSLAMFAHAGEYSRVYRALVGGRGGIVAINEIHRVLSEQVRTELSTVAEDHAVPRDIRVRFIVGTFLTVLTWWLEQKPKLAPAEADALFRRLAIDGIGTLLPRKSARLPG